MRWRDRKERHQSPRSTPPEIRKRAHANPFDNFALVLRQPMEGLIIDRMDRNEQLVTRYLNDAEFHDDLFGLIAKQIYNDVRSANKD